MDTYPPLSSHPPPPGPVLHSHRYALRSCLRAWCSRTKPLIWSPFLHAQRPSCGSGTERPCFPPWSEHPVGRPTSIPTRLTQRRQAAALRALPRPRTAPSNSRSVWSAPACWRCRNSDTARADLPPHPYRARSMPDPIHCSPDDIFPPMAGSHPGPGVGDPNRRPRPEDSKAPPAKLLAPRSRRGSR